MYCKKMDTIGLIGLSGCFMTEFISVERDRRMFINVWWIHKNLEQSGCSIFQNFMNRLIKVMKYLIDDIQDAEKDLNRVDEGSLIF